MKETLNYMVEFITEDQLFKRVLGIAKDGILYIDKGKEK